MVRFAILLLGVTSLTACLETSYVGRDPRKAYVTMQSGQHGYTRNGEFHSDVFGGGLVEVVRGNAQAEDAANTFHDRMIGGFLATLAGAVCLPVVVGYEASRSITNDSNNTNVTNGAYLALGCAVVMIAGSIAMVSAVPYQMDAINIYNDGVDLENWQVPRFPQPPPAMPQAPGAN